jgi:acetyltransferase
MYRIMELARQRGLEVMEGDVLTKNKCMLDLAKSTGFAIELVDGDPTLRKMTRKL